MKSEIEKWNNIIEEWNNAKEEWNKTEKLEDQLEDLIIEMYDLRPSTAYELAQVVKRMAEMAKNEYLFGTQDGSER